MDDEKISHLQYNQTFVVERHAGSLGFGKVVMCHLAYGLASCFFFFDLSRKEAKKKSAWFSKSMSLKI